MVDEEEDMSWCKFLSRSLALGIAAIVGLSLATPAESQEPDCGPYNGNKCKSECTRECESGGCCSWQYAYFEKKPM